MHNLILRISAIIILVSLLERVPFSVEVLINTWETNPNIYAILFSIAPGIFALIISFLLWFFPSTLSSKFANPNETLDKDSINIFGDFLISIVGLYILANAVPDLIYFVSLYIISSSENIEILPFDRAAFVATVVEIIIGLFLLYGSSLIHKFIQRLKKEINEKSL